MTDEILSRQLKELRNSLRLTQPEMAKTLGMGEKMYQLYESGKYDTVKNKSIRRQKLLDKIVEVKKTVAVNNNNVKPAPDTSNLSELEKDNARLRDSLADKTKLIEMMTKIIGMQEHTIRNMQKSLAHAATPKKN